MCELKICKGAICHDNEKICKPEGGNDLSFQN